MPTYEYRCEKCEQTFDAFQSMKDAAYKICPKEHCRQTEWGQGPVKRLLGTGAGLIFKGSGFYSTDYRSASYKEAAKKESASGSGSEGGSDSGSKAAEGQQGGASKPAETKASDSKPASPTGKG
ncbi:MAG TPA: zinc ribbon domain-containing protein [Chthoniobacterales bacterium]